MPLILVMLIALLPRLASGQEPPGFARCDEPAGTKSIVGTWLHNAVQGHGQYLGLRVWTQLELLADGEAIENYFSEDPNLSDVPAFSRLSSTWTSGSFTDPDPDKGTYEVIRLEPYLSATYNPSTNSYAGLRGSFLPVFRRFVLSPAKDEMLLTTSAFLGLADSASALTFPSDLEIRNFQRQVSPATAVEHVSWGQFKTRLR